MLNLPDEDLDYTKGQARSNVAKAIGMRGKKFEKEIYSMLVKRFGEVFVHQQKPFDDYKSRIDFFVYAKNYKFGVDVFYPNDLHSFVCCVNIKEKTYANFDFDVIFLSLNPQIARTQIDKFILRRKNKVLINSKIMDVNEFENYINNIIPHTT